MKMNSIPALAATSALQHTAPRGPSAAERSPAPSSARGQGLGPALPRAPQPRRPRGPPLPQPLPAAGGPAGARPPPGPGRATSGPRPKNGGGGRTSQVAHPRARPRSSAQPHSPSGLSLVPRLRALPPRHLPRPSGPGSRRRRLTNPHRGRPPSSFPHQRPGGAGAQRQHARRREGHGRWETAGRAQARGTRRAGQGACGFRGPFRRVPARARSPAARQAPPLAGRGAKSGAHAHGPGSPGRSVVQGRAPPPPPLCCGRGRPRGRRGGVLPPSGAVLRRCGWPGPSRSRTDRSPQPGSVTPPPPSRAAVAPQPASLPARHLGHRPFCFPLPTTWLHNATASLKAQHELCDGADLPRSPDPCHASPREHHVSLTKYR
ncbi:proline-rich protein HaeIII subfamily 1-like [Falco peregrinus]|uniref:proline-rich protein HaeIII subfamily 1-like n=1 Tax=Falco peregrinus TaxID=8954 RepID=UPI002479343B|nr:proline-rich protein HaeIII subfamily 1-like [Falco peregrinus]